MATKKPKSKTMQRCTEQNGDAKQIGEGLPEMTIGDATEAANWKMAKLLFFWSSEMAMKEADVSCFFVHVVMSEGDRMVDRFEIQREILFR